MNSLRGPGRLTRAKGGVSQSPRNARAHCSLAAPPASYGKFCSMRIRKTVFAILASPAATLCAAALFAGISSARGAPAAGGAQGIVENIASASGASVAVAAVCEGETVASLNAGMRVPLMSVFKFHTALAYLDMLSERGEDALGKIRVEPGDLHKNTHSPMRDKMPPDGSEISRADLLRFMISESDNNACDIIIRECGGTGEIIRRLERLGDRGDARISADENSMQLDVENQRLNTATAEGCARLLGRFLKGEILPPRYAGILKKALEDCATGKDKIPAGLPETAPSGHKTGSSSRLPSGVKIADNDLGFAELPDGRILCIAVFVTDSRQSDAKNAATIAEITRAVWADASQHMKGAAPGAAQNPGAERN